MSLDELRNEMIVVLQRAYRKRRADKIAMSQAQAEIRARRAIQKAAAEEELRRQEAENRRKLAQAERQMARVREILRKRRMNEVRVKQRHTIVKQQAAFAEAERRFWTMNRRFIKTVWKNWTLQVHITKQKINKSKYFLLQMIQIWKQVTEVSSEKRRAALLLQRIYRGKLEYRKVLDMKKKLELNIGKAGAALVRLRYRGMAAAYDGWKIYWHRSKRIKRLRDGALARGIAYRFDMWKNFLEIMKEIKGAAAEVINRFSRSALAKVWVARLKVEMAAAEYIQRCWRGRSGKKNFAAMKQRAWDNEIKVATYRARKIREVKREMFYRILAENKVKKGLLRLNRSLLYITFKYGLKKNAHFAKINRDKEFKLKNEVANSIQSWWRGYLGRQTFLQAIRLREATVYLQACARRNLARTRIYIIRINNHNAVELQCAWRIYVAKNVLHGLKVADFLRAADNDNYDRMLENWCGEETDEEGNNALHRAAMHGAKRCVKLCVAEGIDPNIYNSNGKTALHLAIESVALGRDDTVEWLLDHKAEIEAPDYDGNTPLLLASRLGRAHAVRYIVERDAEVDVLDYEGLTPLMLAITYDEDGTHEGVVAHLLNFAADPNQVGEDGCFPLHNAVSNGEGSIAIIRHLLAYDADLAKQDDQGYTPFMYATNLNLVAICRLMMEFNANVDFRDNQGRTALHIAAGAGNSEVIPVICEGDCDLEAKDADGDTALHIAVNLNFVQTVQTLLSVGVNASVQNEVGDQPAHVAARLGRVECMRKMLEYDAHMGRRNWAELTPIGVARMHSQMEIVDLLKANFSPEQLGEVGDDEGVDVNSWDDEIMDVVEQWEEAWDEVNQVAYWVSTVTGEIRDASHPPEMEVSKIMVARAAGERQMTRRVQVRKGEGELGTAQYNVHHKSEWDEINQMRLEWQSSIKIQKTWRRKSAILAKLRLRLERKSANIIQRAGSSWRWRFHDKNFRSKQRAARKIQAYQRMRYLKHFFKFYERERLWWHRAERICAAFGQRLWRGYIGRREGRRVREVKNQPHPDNKLNFDLWSEHQREAHPPRRSYQLFDEYILYGFPSSWPERELPGKGGFFRDVRFYVNKVTDQAQWWIPDEWAEQDRHDFELREQVRKTGFTMEEFDAATKMQALWKCRQARVNFKMMLAARRIGKQAEIRYLENPDDVVALSNYTLYLHVIEHEYARARKLYRFLFEFMEERGPDNPFVLYSLAIFGAVTLEEDWTYIKDWAYRGNRADLAAGKKAGVSATSYNLANSGFFKAKALFDQSGESWHNYALCRMLVYHDLEGARDAFIRAVVASPHDNRISKNFNMLIQDKDYYGRTPPWDCFDEFQAHQRALAQEREDEEAAKRAELEEAEHMQLASKKVQRWWRNMKAQGMVKLGMTALLKAQLLRESAAGGGYDDGATLYTNVTWEECVDEQGKVFWYNTLTGESTWDKPSFGVGGGASSNDEGSMVSSLEGGTLHLDGDSINDENSIVSIGRQNWEICFDEETGKRFFFNTATEVSQWETPREEEGGGEGSGANMLQLIADEDGVGFPADDEEELPLWELCIDDETGQKFYYNTVTEASSWDTPREYKEELIAKGEKEEWEECEDDEGNVYWYNDLTGEAQWHAPGTEPPEPELWRPEILPLCRGRLVITLVSGENVRGKDSALKAYLKVRVGAKPKGSKKKQKSHKTKTAEKAQAGGKISFRSEKVECDLQEPAGMCDKDGNLNVHFELYDDNFIKDPILCTGSLNVVDMVSCPWWHGDEPKVREVQLYTLGTTVKNGTLSVRVEFWRAQIGCLRVILDQGKNLANKGGVAGTQDPYCKVSLGKQVAKSKTINNGGTDPRFNMEELLIFVGQEDWNKKLMISVWDDDTISDDLIGQAQVDLFRFMSHNGYKKKENPICELHNKKGTKKAGSLMGRIEFMPVGRLNVMVHGAKNLRNPDYLGKPDPYLKIELEQGVPMDFKTMPDDELENRKSRKVKAIEKNVAKSQAHARKLMYASKQTKALNGTLNPEWMAELSFDVIDGDSLKIACFDEDIGKDDLIGETEISLSKVFEMGHIDDTYSLIYKTKKQDKPAGDLKLSLNFWGPPGVKFPQRKVPGVKSFGDRRRRGAGYSPAGLAANAMLDLAGGAEKMKKYLEMPGAGEAPGMLRVTVVEAQNVKGKDSSLNCYVYLRVGPLKSAQGYRTKTVKCKYSSLANPKWDQDFDIPLENVEKLVEDDDVNLTVDIYDDNYVLDTLLGTAVIKLKKLFMQNSGVSKEEFHIFTPAAGGQVKLKICWWKASKGAALLTLVDGKDFRVPSMFKSGKGMDPYVVAALGGQKARSKTVSNGGKNPTFNSEELLIWSDDQSWKQPMRLKVFDDDVGRDALIGETSVDILSVMTPEDANDADNEGSVVRGKLTKKSKEAGELGFGLRFLPCARLTVKCVGGRALRNPDGRGKADPYLVLSLDDSQIKECVSTRKTPSHSDGGADPQWNYDIEFDILDQYELSIKAFDKDFMSKDDIIGSATYSLLPLFRKAALEVRTGSAMMDEWIQLSYMAGSKKGMVPAGDIHIMLYFASPLGVEYPLYRPSITGDTAAMGEEDAGSEVKSAGDVLSIPPLDSLERLLKRERECKEYIPGRFVVTFKQGYKCKGDDSTLQCYAVAKLGGSKSKGDFKKKTKTTPKVQNGDPQFGDERLIFDIKDIEKFLKNLKKNDDNDDIFDEIELEILLYDDNYLKDKEIGSVRIDVKELFFRPSRIWQQWWELDGNGGKLEMSLQFLAAYEGIVKMTLIEGRNLPGGGGDDPYVKLTLPGGKKKQTKRGKTVNNGGKEPSFGREQLLLWCTSEAMFDGLNIEIWDDDIGADDFLGKLNIDLFDYAALTLLSTAPPVMRNFMLVKGGKPSGELIAVMEFFPAATLSVTCYNGKGLRNPNLLGKSDPYVFITGESHCGTIADFEVRSKTVNGGGKNPDWGGQALAPIMIGDHAYLNISVWDDDVGRDDKIGEVTVTIDDVLKQLGKERWLNLTHKNGKKDAGDLRIKFDASLPIGCSDAVEDVMAYPFARPSIQPVAFGSKAYKAIGDEERQLEAQREGEGEGGEAGGLRGDDDQPWSEQLDEEGNVYYFNSLTQETSWEVPEGFIDLDSGDAVDVLGLKNVESFEELVALDPVLKEVSRGRLDCWVHEAQGVTGEDSSLQCYVTVSFGKAKKKGDFYKRTKTGKKKVEDGCPKFRDEKLQLNIRDMKKFWKNIGTGDGTTRAANREGPRREGKVPEKDLEPDGVLLLVKIYDDNYLSDKCIGELEIDVRELLLRPASPWKQFHEFDGGKGKISLTLQFLCCYEGLVRMKLLEGINLIKPDLVGDADPYVTLTLNDRAAGQKQKIKSKVVDGGGVSPIWKGGEQLLLWCSGDSCFDGCQVDVFDQDVGSDDHMGGLKIDIFQYAALTTINGDGVKERSFPLRTRKGKAAGELKAEFDLYVPVELEIVVKEGKDLHNPNLMGKSDPYLQLTSLSQADAGAKVVRTRTVSGGGRAPVWEEEVLRMNLVDHAELKIVCWDDDLGGDDKIGEVELKLKDVYEWSVTQQRLWSEQKVEQEEAVKRDGHGDDVKVGRWIKLTRKGGKEAGEILLQFHTNLIMGGNRNAGARQLDYPQGRPGIEPICLFELKEKYAWEKVNDEQGNLYWLNKFSGATSWETPANFFDHDAETKAKEKIKKDLIEHGEMEKLLALEGEEAGKGGENLLEDVGSQPIVFRKEPVDSLEDLLEEPQKLINLKRGRLLVICHSAKKVKGKDKSLQCYAVVRLAGAKKGKYKSKSKTTGVVKNGNPKFNDFVSLFDINDIEKIVKMISDNGEKSLTCSIEIFDDNYLKDVCIGKCVIDLKELLMRPCTPWRQSFDLDGGGGSVNLTFNFFAAYNGIFRVTLVEARNLTNPNLVGGKPDIYTRLTLKGGRRKQVKKTPTIKDSDLDPKFGRQVFNFWCEETAFFSGLRCELYDDDVGRDDLIGSVNIDLFQYAAVATTNIEAPKDRIYPLKKGGELVACIEFFTCVNLQVIVQQGKALRNPNMFGKTFDPYVSITGTSICGEKEGLGGLKLRSKTHSDGNATPNWKNEELYGMLCDHKTLKLTAYDDDVGKDDVIGLCDIDLTDVYKDGSVDKWFEIKSKNGKKSCGEVKLKLTVKSSRGVSGDVERKVGYPVCWDRRGVPEEKWDTDLQTPFAIRGYGVRGKQYDRVVPARATQAANGGLGGMFDAF